MKGILAMRMTTSLILPKQKWFSLVTGASREPPFTPNVMFVTLTLNEIINNYKSVDEIQWCYNSNKTSLAKLLNIIVLYISENFTTTKLFGFFCVMNVLEVSLLTTAVWSFLTDLICIPYSVYKGPLLFHDGLVIANG